MFRKYALDLARVTEMAAICASSFAGKGDKNAADQAGVDGMRKALGQMDIRGTVVIGEGEIDEAPMLYIGEEVGQGMEGSLEVDIAVDPVEGTNLVAKDAPGSIAVMAFAPKGGFLHAPDMYMEKIAAGPEGIGVLSLDKSVGDNVRDLAKAKGKEIGDMKVAILERDRHQDIIDQVREAGARVMLYSDGDVATAIASSMEESDLDLILGIGGAPEGVLAAAAIKAMGGFFEGRLAPRNDEEIKRAKDMGVEDIRAILSINDLVRSDDCIFSATGITDGAFAKGVEKDGDFVKTHTVIIDSSEGIRHIMSRVRASKLGVK